MDQLARAGALVTADRHGRREVLQPAQPEPSQDTADGGRRDPDLLGDLVTGPALAAPGGDLLDDGLGRRLTQPMGPRGAIEEARSALGLEARAPFVHGLDIDPEVHGHGPGRLAHDQHAADEFGSTMRRQSGILVDVHSVLPWTLKHHNLSFLGQGPNGQPTESSQLSPSAAGSAACLRVDGLLPYGQRERTLFTATALYQRRTSRPLSTL